MLAMVITVTVQSFYTLDMNIRRIDRDLQRAAGTYLLFFAFLPIPMVVLGLVIPRKTRLEKFGSGRWRTKIAILLTSAAILTLGAGFRVGTNFMNPRPRDDPAWYHAKWCFYFFNFVLETIVTYMYLVLRVDLRFHIPNGSKGPGDYLKKPANGDAEKEEERPTSSWGGARIEVFDDHSPVETSFSKDEEAAFAKKKTSE
jgi:Protein of unknown function (DUF3112)